jgi:nitroreductase
MLIAVDKLKCAKCGVCVKRMEGYCISTVDGFPVFDEALCNTCQKCVAICPSRAITVDGQYPDRIGNALALDPGKLREMMERRRSIKKFKNREVPADILEKILAAANYAPNQNKNISLRVIDDKALIAEIDRRAVQFVKTWYRILFGSKWLTRLIRLIYPDIMTIKKKMEHGGFRHVLYENTQVIVLATGNRNVAVTESSAHYVLSSLMFMAEALGIGNCLMDSVYLAFRTSRKLRKTFGVREDVLGALTLGYSNEAIVNIPRGYGMKVAYNVGEQRS